MNKIMIDEEKEKVYITNVKMYSGTTFHNNENKKFMICNRNLTYRLRNTKNSYAFYILDVENGNIWGSFIKSEEPMFKEIRDEYKGNDFYMTEDDVKIWNKIKKEKEEK